MPELTWSQVMASFAMAQVRWAMNGFPIVPANIKADRGSKCQACPQRKGYWCRLCKCLIYLKTSLATEQCPANPPRWLRF